MITIEEQQKLFLNLERKLNRKITAYAIGGTAMTFLGIKDSTVDIDIVFETTADREEFKRAITSLGYQKMDHRLIYGAKTNCPEMFTLGTDNRFDLFVNDIIDFVFSEKMRERAKDMHQFGDKFILKIADPHDIILMKCATERLKDKDDARKIIESRNIDWHILINEAKNQVKLGKRKAIFDLGCFLEDMKKDLHVNIPKEIIDELWKAFKRPRNVKTKRKSQAE